MEAAAAAASGGGGLALLPGVLLLLALSTLVISRWSNRNSSRLPPSSMALPLIGHLHLIRPPPHRAFDRILARYEPLVYLLPQPFHALRRRRHSGRCTGPPQARGQHSEAVVTVRTTTGHLTSESDV